MIRSLVVRSHVARVASFRRTQLRSFTHTLQTLNKKTKLTDQKYDEAEMMSSRLTEQPYYAKRSTEEQSERSFDDFYEESSGPSSEAELKRYQRIEIIKGLLAGVLTLGGIFGGYWLYTEVPAIKAWWYGDGDFPVELPKKKKKKTFELPSITNKNDSSVPGLYIWGDNSNYISSSDKKRQEVRNPIRHDWFDGKTLKKVVLGETSAFAIDDKGDLIQWGKGYNGEATPQYSVKGDHIVDAKFSNEIIYALTRKGEVLVIPENEQRQKTLDGLKKRDWLFRKTTKPYSKLDLNPIKKDEKVTSFDAGKEHLVILTDKGRAYVTSTGFKQQDKSYGQFGIPDFSQFSKPPKPNQLHEITLLNQHIQRTAKGRIDHIEPRFIKKVVCGNYHTMALDSNGEVYTFGHNTYGQLGHPVSYETQFITIPKKINLFSKHIRRDMFPDVLDIHAGGDTSFATIKPVHMYQLVKGTMDPKNSMNDEEAFTLGWGKNLKGQIGNNLFIHSQFDPVKIRELAKFEDFNDDTGEMERVGIKEWSSGQEHTFIKLNNKDVLFWGANDFAQLGNGKRNRVPKPSSPPALIEPSFTEKTYADLTFANRLQLNENQHIVAGENNSAIFYTTK